MSINHYYNYNPTYPFKKYNRSPNNIKLNHRPSPSQKPCKYIIQRKRCPKGKECSFNHQLCKVHLHGNKCEKGILCELVHRKPNNTNTPYKVLELMGETPENWSVFLHASACKQEKLELKKRGIAIEKIPSPQLRKKAEELLKTNKTRLEKMKEEGENVVWALDTSQEVPGFELFLNGQYYEVFGFVMKEILPFYTRLEIEDLRQKINFEEGIDSVSVNATKSSRMRRVTASKRIVLKGIEVLINSHIYVQVEEKKDTREQETKGNEEEMHGYIVRFFPSDTPRDTFVSCYQNFSIQTPKIAESQIFPHFIELLKKKENEEFFFQEFVCPSNLKTKENWFWKYLYPSSREHFVGLQKPKLVNGEKD